MDKASRDRLANKVKNLRGNQTHIEFGKILGVSGGSISHWENSKNIPSLENFEKLAELSNQLPEQFLAEVYGRKIATDECPTVTSIIISMADRDIAEILVSIAKRLEGGGK